MNISRWLIITIFSLQSLALEIEFGKISPTVLAYQEQCKVNYTNKSLPKGWQKNFCEVVKNGQSCKHIPKKYLVDCNTQLETVNPLDALGSCFDGFFTSVTEMWDFLSEVISLIYNEEKRSELSEEGSAFVDSLALYYETEVIKAKDNMSGPFQDTRAGYFAAKSLFTKIIQDFLVEPLADKYKEYACYNKEGAVHYTCQTLTEYFFPPLVIITAIKKGKKVARSLKDDDSELSGPIVVNESIPDNPDRRSQLRWRLADEFGRGVKKAYYRHSYESPISDIKPPRIGMAQEYKSDAYTLLTQTKPLSANIPLIDKHLKEATIKKVHNKKGKLVGGSNDIQLIELEDGTMGVFKPRNEADWLSNYRGEILAYEVDKTLNLDLVPPTVERTIDGKVGSFQKFEKSLGDGNTHLSFAKPEEIDKQNFFDLIIDNRDRHDGNFLVNKYGNIHSIDHGLSFTGRGYNAKRFDEVEESITRFLKTQEGTDAIKKLETLNRDKFYQGLSDYVGPLDASRTMERIDFIIKLNKTIE